MSLLIRLSDRWTRHSASAIVLTGMGLAGVAGCSFNLTPGERLAASARDEQDVKPPVTTSALSRVLRRQNEVSSSEAEQQESRSSSSTTIARGRLFSAIVDRFPSRGDSERDPFLESEITVDDVESQTAELGEASERPHENLSRRSLVQSPSPQRTAEDLRRMFEEDAAGVAHAREADPTLTAQEPAPVDVETLPEWARPQSSEMERTPTMPVQTASRSAINSPARGVEANPFAKNEEERAAVDASDRVAGPARKGLRELMAQTSAVGVGPKVRESTFAAAAFAEREEAELVQPVEAVTHRPAALRDPFSDPQVGDSAEASVVGTSPFASGSERRTAAATPWTTQVSPEPSTPVAPPFAGERPTPATPFPTAPEWRGVRANSPVSLAVVDQQVPAPSIDDPAGVKHADVTDPSNRPGRLLPRSLPAQDPVVSGGDETLALTVPPAEGPLLAPPASLAPLSIAPPPAPELELTAPPVLAASDETHDRSRGYGGWMIGGALLAAGMWLFGFGNRRSTRRDSRVEQKQ